jgi:hypothetical protein
MQRWIIAGIVAVALAGVGLVGTYLWLQGERAKRPDRIWVPLVLNPEVPVEQHENAATELRERLESDEVLGKICTELALQSRWGHATEDQAIAELRRRLFVEIGEHDYQPSMNIGFDGISRENAMLRELTERLMEDVAKILNPNAPPPDDSL